MNAQSDIKAGNLLDALATALPELEGAKKNAANPHLKSKYADLGSVIDAVRPIAAHGLWFIQETHESERGVMVETHYIGFGERISAGKLFVPANKQDAQGYGSALTYARRYSLQTAFGLSTEDDDGHAAARGQSRSEVSPAAADLMPDTEYNKLIQLVEATGANVNAMLKFLKINVANDNLRLLNQDQYAQVLEALNTKLAAKVKAETDARAKEPA